MRGRVVDDRDAIGQRRRGVRADLERERALRGCGGPAPDVEQFGCVAEPPETFEAGRREHEPIDPTVVVRVVQAPEPGVDIAADADDIEIGSSREQLGAAPGRARPDA